MDNYVKNFIDQIKTAREKQQILSIRGSGSKAFYGNPVAADAVFLDTSAYRGVVSYEPSELVLTAKAGTPLSEIESLLAENGQMLAFEPPRFDTGTSNGSHINSSAASDGTFGGCIASGLAGPRRMQAGPLSDFVLGSQFLNSAGQVLNFGGEVMKNVAGYDLSRLLAGSLGGLGLVLQASVKVLPQPYTEITTVLELGENKALELCLHWNSLPLPISATAWLADDNLVVNNQAGSNQADSSKAGIKNGGLLYIRLSGNDSAVRQALQDIGGQTIDAASAATFWSSIRDQHHDFFRDSGPLWRLSLPAGVPSLGVGHELHECGGAIRWVKGNHETVELRSKVKALGGNVCLFRRAGLSEHIAAFDGLSAPVLKLHQQIKQRLDPNNVFDFKRLVTQV